MTENKKDESIYEEAVRQYAKLRPKYELYCVKLQELLRTLIEEFHIRIHTIEGRAKEISNYREKIARPGKRYEKPLEEISDLCGIRIILYYNEDVIKVSDLLHSEFSIDMDKSTDKGTQLEPHEFGYTSIHLILSLSESRSNLLEWRQFKDFVAEVQIRTMLQHAWAAISHVLQYKKKEEVPRDLRRRLFRLSGLLELADEQFSFLNQQNIALVASLAESSTEFIGSVEVNRMSLIEWLSRSDLPKKFLTIALGAGFETEGYPEGREERDVSEIAWICSQAKINTISELEGILKKVIPVSSSYLVSLYSHDKIKWTVSAPFLIKILLISVLNRYAEIDDLVNHGWSKKIAEQVLVTAKKFF